MWARKIDSKTSPGMWNHSFRVDKYILMVGSPEKVRQINGEMETECLKANKHEIRRN